MLGWLVELKCTKNLNPDDAMYKNNDTAHQHEHWACGMYFWH